MWSASQLLWLLQRGHHPEHNHFKPIEFREDYLHLPVSRDALLLIYDSKDAYTGESLSAKLTQCDHIMECQIPAHLFNHLYKKYEDRGHDVCEITNAIPIVKEITNRQENLVPVHQDINRLKGSGIKSFLDERTFMGSTVLFTSHLIEAHKQLSRNQLGGMEKKYLDRQVSATIRSKLKRQLKQAERKLNDEADNQTIERLKRSVRGLRIQVNTT
ncbi:hypothetical protein BBJ28_00022938 [Nothophytophthora sp. Chile5]|nr:hypothetical protein BBJ28_00022938 [Nothophytophthora sp. Chile5]